MAPSPLRNTNNPLVHVATAPNEVIAAMWVDILEQNRIHALAKSGPLKAGLYAFNEPVDIKVLKLQAEEAKQLLQPFIEPDTTEDKKE
jgi:hypothetical protein